MEKKLVKVENVDPQIKPALRVASGRGFLLFSYFFSFFFPLFQTWDLKPLQRRVPFQCKLVHPEVSSTAI